MLAWGGSMGPCMGLETTAPVAESLAGVSTPGSQPALWFYFCCVFLGNTALRGLTSGYCVDPMRSVCAEPSTGTQAEPGHKEEPSLFYY